MSMWRHNVQPILFWFSVGVLTTVVLQYCAESRAWAAEEPDPWTVEVAETYGFDALELQGAVNTTRLDPLEYLYAVGELRRPQPIWTVWDRLAQCESNGRWHIDAYHDGGLQFHPQTWLAYGGAQYARFAWQATREQQIAIAERVLRGQGWRAWPACSRILRLR